MNNSIFDNSWRSVIFHNRTEFSVDVKAYLPNTGNNKANPKVPEKLIKACDTSIFGLKYVGDVIFEVKLETTVNPKKLLVTVPISKECKEYHVVITEEKAIYWDYQNRVGPNEDNGIKRIHVGCGPQNIFPDWWNVDIRSFQGIDTVMDVTQTWPFQDIDFIYGEHFLEHLPLDGAINFLVSSGNSLKLGGKIRLTTPNLAWVIDSHFPVNDAPTHAKVNGTFDINRAFHGWGHQFLYSQEFLEYLLSELGYEQIVFFEYGKSDTPALSYLERHGKFRKRNNLSNLIIAEATRGKGEISFSQQLTKQIEVMFMRYYRGGH
jgi:predicted SAM-dependent methyltransferase